MEIMNQGEDGNKRKYSDETQNANTRKKLKAELALDSQNVFNTAGFDAINKTITALALAVVDVEIDEISLIERHFYHFKRSSIEKLRKKDYIFFRV